MDRLLLASRHPLRAALGATSAAAHNVGETGADYGRQFLLGWLGGLVFFGTFLA